MTDRQKENLIAIGIAMLLVILAFLFLAALFSGCTTSRKASADIQNNSQVKKTDSLAVSKSGATSSNENTWFREWISMGGNKDSFVSKEIQLKPIYHTSTQPVVIYREGGTNKQEQTYYNFDSAFKAVSDSTNKDKIKTSETSKTQVLSLWHMIGIAVAAALFFRFVPLPTISFNKNKSS